jgi:hypothetical protein
MASEKVEDRQNVASQDISGPGSKKIISFMRYAHFLGAVLVYHLQL